MKHQHAALTNWKPMNEDPGAAGDWRVIGWWHLLQFGLLLKSEVWNVYAQGRKVDTLLAF
ncbi:MAG TPA: hypothetical protein PLM33_00085 [Acidobacteriota bacterium]|nr:hypothetical protein [Acidobacteriota bacterium]HRR25677.1 hypothetical protein [Acidobacteriota bacterium]HRR55389.1 hypothetical protein [Acidobacteriota bacterium]HRV09532.1 hypothetical protein [Acidobacteriota bacterium]